MTLDSLISSIVSNLVNPAIYLLMAVALIIFFWGVYEYIRDAGDATARATGANHMLYGVIGLAVMLSAAGIVNLVISFFR